MGDKILLPYDGSGPAKKALEYTIEKFPDAEITALYVVPVPENYSAAFEESKNRIPEPEQATERGRDILDDAAAIADELGHEIDTDVDTGQPDHVIVDRAETDGFDSIVVGSHGREGVSRILLGSVAESVVRRAPTPVIVVR
ncbi:universal stress protein [Natronorubrum sp. JWXQ-INN-674]|uniref:Universal stress protein n=1 Tax=Natronorubrum halalkaliphilum TaxID=2691917 RepID=A0A6B0VSF9_9EURY|nr:universal stress protein [Natronorubrum halalkaliphilum]MXV64063.1 universal stress protein [Natronorubrum halalkaliphilum]